MGKRYFKDFYGGSASIGETARGHVLTVCDGSGRRVLRRTYGTYRGARAAMGRASDGWREVGAEG